jgi:hypothetical protein
MGMMCTTCEIVGSNQLHLSCKVLTAWPCNTTNRGKPYHRSNHKYAEQYACMQPGHFVLLQCHPSSNPRLVQAHISVLLPTGGITLQQQVPLAHISASLTVVSMP